MGFWNALSLIGFLIGVVSFIVSLLAGWNELRQRWEAFANWRASRSKDRAQRRIDFLEAQLDFYEVMVKNPAVLTAYLADYIITGLGLACLAAAALALGLALSLGGQIDYEPKFFLTNIFFSPQMANFTFLLASLLFLNSVRIFGRAKDETARIRGIEQTRVETTSSIKKLRLITEPPLEKPISTPPTQ